MTALVIAMVGRKGGSGKTTTAFNLAGALAATNKRVLLVDADPQGSLSRILMGDMPSEGLGARLIAPARGVSDLIAPTGTPNLDLLPGNATMRETRSQLAGNPAASVRLRSLLTPLAGYDAIIIDTPPELDFPSASAVLAAQLCLLPTDLSQQSLDALEDTVRFVAEQEPLGGGRLAGIVPTDVRAREVFDRVASTCNDLGLFAEEYDTRANEMLGNFPQGLTHLSHIAAAVAIANARRDDPSAGERATASHSRG